VKAKSAAKKGNQLALLISSTIDGYSGHADTVQAVTKRK
jgi:hypothetical protein